MADAPQTHHPQTDGPASDIVSSVWLAGFEPMTLDEREQHALELIREWEPDEGYYLAFSGGKDSIVCKHLLKLAGVRFDAHYNQTTIDPPELVRYIKAHHADVGWNLPEHGNMMHRVAEAPKAPPTRLMRWCCGEYKERSGEGRVRVFGVRKAESASRAKRWNEVADYNGQLVLCPIVLWSDEEVWAFIRKHALPYCSLYDEGWTRLGCVGCPLATPAMQAKEFARWPAFERNWKKAIVANWEKWHDVPREDGKPRYHAKFKTAEDFWQWWRTQRAPDYFREDCQGGLLWTNQPEDTESSANVQSEPRGT